MKIQCPLCDAVELTSAGTSLTCPEPACGLVVPETVEPLDENTPGNAAEATRWQGRARVYARTERSEEAIAAATHAITMHERLRAADAAYLDEPWADALVERAELLEEQGDVPAFFTDMQAAIAIWKERWRSGKPLDGRKFIHALHRASQAQERSGEFEAAFRNLTDLIGFAQASASAGLPVDDRLLAECHLSRAFVGTALRNDTVLGDFEQAIHLWRDAEHAGRSFDRNRLAVANLNYGISLYRVEPRGERVIDRLEDAIGVWKRMRDAGEPHDRNGWAIALMYQGLACMAREDIDQTISAFSKALEVWDTMIAEGDPIDLSSYATALIDRGAAYFNQDRKAAAKADFQRARQLMERASSDGLGAFERPLAKVREWLQACEE